MGITEHLFLARAFAQKGDYVQTNELCFYSIHWCSRISFIVNVLAVAHVK